MYCRMTFLKKLFLCLGLMACLLSSAIAKTNKDAGETQLFKQLAGPADEITSMRLPNPSTLGLRSKAAMIPIWAKAGKSGAWTAEIPVDNAKGFKLMLLAPNSRDWDIYLALQPDEQFINLRQDAGLNGIEREETIYGLDGEQFPTEVFAFDYIRTGVLKVQINTKQSNRDSAKPIGYLVVASESPYRLYSFVNTHETVVGRNVGLVASLFDSSTSDETSAPAALTRTIERAVAKVQTPTGETEQLLMADDGNHSDGNAGDGVFGSNFIPRAAGKYMVQLIAEGTTPDGNEFIRTSEHLLQIVATRATVGRNASANFIDDVRLRLSLPVKGLSAGQKVIVYAEVWGRDATKDAQPVAWISSMALAEKLSAGRRANTVVPLTLDSRWLARASAKESYELRNVRIQDPDYFVTLGSADTVSLPEISLPELDQKTSGEITDEMRTGPRPERDWTINGVGSRVMLIHGYCSGGVTFPTSQFTNFAVFNDPGQNRTHDQFAQLIRNFGSQFYSFGAVAHSQGGAASLHLYTYYWSGLDYATGPRLIQSVGTPYQGTALAGNLALLGQIFGVGCGVNNNMTYSGAAAWLSGIPSWARAKVYYSTTSFTDVWWRYDYCNIASDVFLSDPDDGVVERAYGQLPGANNRGHKTGWCHVSGMRDPAQTSDASRNADMNANAAR